MPTLYLTPNDAVLRLSSGRLLVEQPGASTLCIGLREVENVLVFGNAQVTTAALSALLAQGSPLAFLTSSGRLKGRLVSSIEKNASRRLRQFERRYDEEFRLDFARRVVGGKIANARAVLLRLGRNTTLANDTSATCPPVLRSPVLRSQALRSQVLRETTKNLRYSVSSARCCGNLETLRGVEGAAARDYFAALRVAGAHRLGFERRGKRPSPDAFNALLNLGYSLVGHEILTALAACGLDPTLGFYHVEALGRPALALDLLEEFRSPLVDRWALSLVNRNVVQTADFEVVKGDFRLTNQALKRVLNHYEGSVSASFTDARSGSKVTFRTLFMYQARRLRHAIEENTPYVPYRHK